jgi:sugar-specific transcriptional regulator TrmB
MIEQTLQKLGLRDEEIKTFLFLVENGEQTAGILAKKTGLSRPSLYGFVQKLQKLGLVIESQKNGVKTFIASPKEKVSAVFDEKISELEEGKNVMEKTYQEVLKMGVTVNPKFQLFEGKEGMKQVLKDMMLYSNIETKAYWPIQAMIEILSEDFFKKLNKDRIQQKLYTRAIWPQGQAVDIKKHPYLGAGGKFLREIRIAPKDIGFSMGYWIYGNKVAFISSKKESFGFIIESKELVEMLSSQFEVIWNLSKSLSGKGNEGEEFLKEIKSKM